LITPFRMSVLRKRGGKTYAPGAVKKERMALAPIVWGNYQPSLRQKKKGLNKMFNWLQNKLGMISLTEKIEKHHQEHQVHWKVVTERLKYIVTRMSHRDDQLLEIKERVKKLESKISETPPPSAVSIWPGEDKNLPLKPSGTKVRQTVKSKVLTCLAQNKGNGVHYMTIAKFLGRNKTEISAILAKMIRKGTVVKLKPGVYALTPLKDTLHDPQ
jgi:hypothetical protein